MNLCIAVLTNAQAADQRSMIGYGQILIEAAQQAGAKVVEWRGASFFGRLPLRGSLRKLALSLDRFVITPLTLLGRQADIVHVVDPGNCIYLPLIRYKRSIVTVHDMIPYLADAGRLEGFRPSPFGKLLMKWILHQLTRVDQIICVSHATYRDLLELSNVNPEQIEVIHNAVFQPMGPAPPQTCARVREKYHLPAEAPFILHVGRNFYKNRGTVLESVALLRKSRPDVHLVLVGELEVPLVVKAARLGFGSSLHVLPYVAQEDMAALYTTASVLLFPSLYEGFGLPVLEAQMCGTPVVCSDAGSLPEVVNEEAVLVPAMDPVLQAEVLLAIINNSSTYCNRRVIPVKEIFTKLAWIASHRQIYSSLQNQIS